MKKALMHGVLAGILAGIASFVFNYVYSEALLLDFSLVLTPMGIFGASIFGCVLASLGYHILSRKIPNYGELLFTLLFLGLTFASFYGPFASKLPMEVQDKEFFMGLAIPMHLFPALFWFSTKFLFYRKQEV